jgi:Heparinase II/III-like protein
MLLAKAALGERRRLVSGALAPLADSLARDLDRLVQSNDIYIPNKKARLTRAGGRCPQCGATLDFDPWSRQRYRCSRCGIELAGEDYDGMWIMWYQLWLAERAVHAAALYAMRGDAMHRLLAERILGLYTERYLSYPNRDNVLGPTRVFFSTYLESIWTLQLACALDLLETAAGKGALGATVRERVLEPSAALIALYDEGLSNRQVWNNAALLACGILLGNATQAERAVMGPSGINTHLERVLLADGMWYEGENYHLFAHRGLWYGVTLADAVGLAIPNELRARYHCGFETPFLTALPDFTFPARRDSQYRVSLRQWRIAESCELGLAVTPRSILAAALRELYRADIPQGGTGRDRSTAEAERNAPSSRLTRADLGWKSLLFASEQPAIAAESASVGSVLLAHQGFAVMRRDRNRVYVALDYGESGGGHGHPDRLNLWLVVGEARILEDVGTGSYVDPSLHWYRSTLAHNAPLAGGASQVQTTGELLAHQERGEFGWTLARAAIAPNVNAERAVVVAEDYLVDELQWSGRPDTVLDVPLHIVGAAAAVSSWADATIPGGTGLEDGFSHIVQSSVSAPLRSVLLRGNVSGVPVKLWLAADDPFALWRLRGPGPPNEPPRDFFLVRSSAATGRLRTVIDWSDSIDNVDASEETLVVTRRDGSRHTHARQETDWHIGAGDDRIVLTRGRARLPFRAPATPIEPVEPQTIVVPRLESLQDRPGDLAHDARANRVTLGASHYRRSEQSWDEAGRPAATLAFAATATDFHIDISVEKELRARFPAQSTNPLDNEHPDINVDGVQLYLDGDSWILIPEPDAPNVRVTARHVAGSRDAPSLRAKWTPTSSGYGMRVTVPLGELTAREPLLGDVIVNETLPERERRRGQLVLSGARGEWVYLRGDRQESSRFFRFVIANA